MRKNGFATKIKEIALKNNQGKIIVTDVMSQYNDEIFTSGDKGRKKMFNQIDRDFLHNPGNDIKGKMKKYAHPTATVQGTTSENKYRGDASSVLSSIRKIYKKGKKKSKQSTPRNFYPEVNQNGSRLNNGTRIEADIIEDDNILERCKAMKAYCFSFFTCDAPNFIDARKDGRMSDGCRNQVIDMFNEIRDALDKVENDLI